MILLYRTPTPGDVLYAVYSLEWSRGFVHSTNVPLAEFEIEDESANSALCRELVAAMMRFDESGQTKYYIDDQGQGPELFVRDNWEEYEAEI